MRSRPWTCSRCLTRTIYPPSRLQVRFQGNAPSSKLASPSVPPALLSKARSVTQEHATLSKSLDENFDTRTAKRAGELSAVVTALKEWEKAGESLTELRGLLQDPSTDSELRELASEDIATTSDQLANAAQALRSSLIPKHPFAHLPCLLELRPGAGGSEAALFAGDLLRMYRAYCARRGLRSVLIKYEAADGSGESHGESALQEAVLEVETEGAYGILKCEAGVHRVQRVPATETKGRTHTSAASVMVLPSLSSNGTAEAAELDFDDPSSDYYVDPKDVRTDVMRARGAGGQHVNTTDSAVRLTHVPTGTVVSMQETRSQLKNREKAWNVLRARLAQARQEARMEEMLRLRRSVVGVAKMGRGDKVRTYNWGQQRVTDHRSGLSVHNLDDVMEGGDSLEKVMQSVRDWHLEQDMEGLLAE